MICQKKKRREEQPSQLGRNPSSLCRARSRRKPSSSPLRPRTLSSPTDARDPHVISLLPYLNEAEHEPEEIDPETTTILVGYDLLTPPI